jgi:hypothetical protein
MLLSIEELHAAYGHCALPDGKQSIFEGIELGAQISSASGPCEESSSVGLEEDSS